MMNTRKAASRLLIGLVLAIVAPTINALEIKVDDIGKIVVNADTGGVKGAFTVTKKNPDGSTMTLAQLEKFLAQDHLNWFQYAVNKGTPDATFPAKFIDPQKGGQIPLWADGRPWYWDETRPPPVKETLPDGTKVLEGGFKAPPTFIPPAGKTELDVQGPSTGSTLSYADFPSGLDLDFSTFLISDYGNQTYKVLDGGFSWTARKGTPTAITGPTAGATFNKEMQDKIQTDFGWKRAAAPDSSSSTADSPAWNLRERAPQNSLITVQPTSKGNQLVNSDGSIVQYAQTVSQGNTSVLFQIPGVINGKKVTDATQKTTAKKDPGTLQLSAFDSSGNMVDSFSEWLVANGYNYPNELDIPDFFPDINSGLDEVYYGVDAAALLDFGKSFVNLFSFGDSFTVSELTSLLPGYLFSASPLYYVPGQGWDGTPLDPGMQLSYVAFHQADVPEPGTLVLTLIAISAGMRAGRKLRKEIMPDPAYFA